MSPRAVVAGLQARGGFELVSHNEAPSQLRLMGRVPSERMSDWLLVIGRLLEAPAEAPWKVDISKNYFKKQGKTVFAWRLVFQGEGLASHYAALAQWIAGTPASSRVDVMEEPLYGAQRTFANGKGAHRVGG